MDAGGVLRTPVLQFLGDGCQGKQIVVLRLGLIPLKRLATAAHHIISAVVLQHVFLGVRLMFVLHQPGGKGEVGRFHGCIAMIHADHNGIIHLVSCSFRSCCF